MQLNSPRDLFLHELHLIYDAEHTIAELASDAAGKVQDQNLVQLLSGDAQEVGQEVKKLEQCFQALGAQPQRMTCNAVEGIRKDYQSARDQNPSSDVFDLAVLAIFIKIEHYEVATYRWLIDQAMLMGETQVAQTLQSILVEEEESASRQERLSHELSQQMLAGV